LFSHGIVCPCGAEAGMSGVTQSITGVYLGARHHAAPFHTNRARYKDVYFSWFFTAFGGI